MPTVTIQIRWELQTTSFSWIAVEYKCYNGNAINSMYIWSPPWTKIMLQKQRHISVLIPNSLVAYRSQVASAPSNASINVSYTQPDPSKRLRRCHITQNQSGYCKLKHLWGYYEVTLTLLWQELSHMQHCRKSVSQYPLRYYWRAVAQRYETYIAAEEDIGCSYGLIKVVDLLFLNISCLVHNLLGKFHISFLANVHQCSPTCSNDCTSPTSCEQRSKVNDPK